MRKFSILLVMISGILQVGALTISEIMYDPQGSDTSREWVEVYNDTGSPLNLTTWKFFESGTNHSITSYSGGTSIPVGGYGIIADNPIKFLEDYPTYQGVLYDSTFSLSNTGEHLSFKESSSGPEISFVDYDTSLGGNNDGSTLSLIDGVWKRGTATPGSTNQFQQLTLETNSITSTATETQTTVAQMSPPSADIVFYMPEEKIVVAGVDTPFSVFGLTRNGNTINNLTYSWAFGDGGQGIGSTTLYRYAYPGRYLAKVEGGNGYVTGTGHMRVRVVSPDIIISKINTGKYGAYIDITNPNTYDLDLSQWKLSINDSMFSFPKNTTIIGGVTTHFSGLAMGFASTTISSSTVVRILFPNQEEVTRYSNKVEEENKFLPSTTTEKLTINSVKVKPKIKQQTIPVVKPIIVSTSSPVIIHKDSSNKDTRIISFLKAIFTRK